MKTRAWLAFLCLFVVTTLSTPIVFAAPIAKLYVQVTTCKIPAIRLYGISTCRNRDQQALNTLMNTLGSNYTLVQNESDADAKVGMKLIQSSSTGTTECSVEVSIKGGGYGSATYTQEAGFLNWHFKKAEQAAANEVQMLLGQFAKN